MNIEIASLIGSIIAVTVSVGLSIALKINFNHKFELLEMKINMMINEKKVKKHC